MRKKLKINSQIESYLNSQSFSITYSIQGVKNEK